VDEDAVRMARCGPGSKRGATLPAICGFISPRLGKKIASEVTKHDIATLSNDIVAGKLGVPSVANARHMRRAASGLFNWAAEAGRDYVTARPCVNLPKLDPGASAHARPVRDQDFLARPRPGRPALGSQDPPRAEIRTDHHAGLE
jgi:hypothetical protein